MKIVAICGSARKGNSYSILNSIPEYYPDIDYKLLMLKDLNIEQCKGCYSCYLRGEETCPLKDDRDMVIKEMEDADGVVFQSPVYVNMITSIMKRFIERVGFISHRPPFHDKYAMVMAVAGGFGTEEANQYMSDIISSFGFNMVPDLELMIATKSEKENEYNRMKMTEAFDTLISRIKTGERNPPEIRQLVMYQIFKSLSTRLPDYYKADHQYYTNQPNYPYAGKIPFYKKFITKRAAASAVADMMKNR